LLLRVEALTARAESSVAADVLLLWALGGWRSGEEGRRGAPVPGRRRRAEGGREEGAGVRDEVARVTVGEVEMKRGERKPAFPQECA
jgi:hypothetical protein